MPTLSSRHQPPWSLQAAVLTHSCVTDTYLPNEHGTRLHSWAKSPYSCKCHWVEEGIRVISVRDSVTFIVPALGRYFQAPSLAQAESGGAANVVLLMPHVHQNPRLPESHPSPQCHLCCEILREKPLCYGSRLQHGLQYKVPIHSRLTILGHTGCWLPEGNCLGAE